MHTIVTSVYMEVSSDLFFELEFSITKSVMNSFPDDITMTADGVDTYQIVKDAKRYK